MTVVSQKPALLCSGLGLEALQDHFWTASVLKIKVEVVDWYNMIISYYSYPATPF